MSELSPVYKGLMVLLEKAMIVKMSIRLSVQEPSATTNNKETCIQNFLQNSEMFDLENPNLEKCFLGTTCVVLLAKKKTFFLEIVENIDDMFFRHYMHSDICNIFKPTTYYFASL